MVDFQTHKMLVEVFDNPLPIKYDSKLTSKWKKELGSKVRYISVYTTQYQGQDYLIYEFNVENFWEYHFSHAVEGVKDIDFYKSAPSQLYSTIIDLYFKKLDADKQVRIYAPNKRTSKLYLKIVLKYIEKYPNKRVVTGIEKAIDGNGYETITVTNKQVNENLGI